MKLENALMLTVVAGVGYLLMKQAQAAQSARLPSPVKEYVPGQFSTTNPEYG